jgi:hypothetical protein
MESIHFTALLAMPGSSFEEIETNANRGKCRQALNATLAEICSLSGLIEFPLLGSVTRATAELLDHEWQGDRPDRRLYPPVLKLEIELPSALLAGIDIPPEISKEHHSLVLELLCPRYFMKRVQDLLLIANISRMGSIEVVDSVVIEDGFQRYGALRPVNTRYLQAGLSLAESVGWPPLRSLPLSEAWQWAVEHIDYLDGFAKSPTGRALNALSRILEDSDDSFDPMKLIWALVGIEALYVKGSTGVRQQVVEKSQTLLGPLETHKKRIGRMYDWRSRFLHGDWDFPPLETSAGMIADGRPEVGDYYKGLCEAIEFGTAILVASLQTIIQRNWNGLDFSYKVDNYADRPDVRME